MRSKLEQMGLWSLKGVGALLAVLASVLYAVIGEWVLAALAVFITVEHLAAARMTMEIERLQAQIAEMEAGGS